MSGPPLFILCYTVQYTIHRENTSGKENFSKSKSKKGQKLKSNKTNNRPEHVYA